MKALNRRNPTRYIFKMTVIVSASLFSFIPLQGSTYSNGEESQSTNELRSFNENDCVPIEPDLVLEDWMTVPFNQGLQETDLILEDWMTQPFANSIGETELAVESWMTKPFGNEFAEPELAVESWMTEVFK